MTLPVQAVGRSAAKLTLSGAVSASVYLNLAIGAGVGATGLTFNGATAVNGGWLVSVTFTTTAAATLTVLLGAATGTAAGNETFTGAGTAALYFGKPMLAAWCCGSFLRGWFHGK